MKTFKYILVAILSVNIFVWLITYFLNINLFTILQIQTSNLAIEEPRYKLNANSSNVKGNFAIEEPRYKLNSDMQEMYSIELLFTYLIRNAKDMVLLTFKRFFKKWQMV